MQVEGHVLGIPGIAPKAEEKLPTLRCRARGRNTHTDKAFAAADLHLEMFRRGWKLRTAGFGKGGREQEPSLGEIRCSHDHDVDERKTEEEVEEPHELGRHGRKAWNVSALPATGFARPASRGRW